MISPEKACELVRSALEPSLLKPVYRHYTVNIESDYSLSRSAFGWLSENIEKDDYESYVDVPWVFWFRHERDAVEFKLRFG